jgi:hypothetical protein
MLGSAQLLREHWEETFRRAGVSQTQLQAMSDYDFVKACDVLIDAGFSVPELPDAADSSAQSALFASIRANPKPPTPAPERISTGGRPSFLTRAPNFQPPPSALDPSVVIRSASWNDSLAGAQFGSVDSPSQAQLNASIDEDPEFERSFQTALMELSSGDDHVTESEDGEEVRPA